MVTVREVEAEQAEDGSCNGLRKRSMSGESAGSYAVSCDDACSSEDENIMFHDNYMVRNTRLATTKAWRRAGGKNRIRYERRSSRRKWRYESKTNDDNFNSDQEASDDEGDDDYFNDYINQEIFCPSCAIINSSHPQDLRSIQRTQYLSVTEWSTLFVGLLVCASLLSVAMKVATFFMIVCFSLYTMKRAPILWRAIMYLGNSEDSYFRCQNETSTNVGIVQHQSSQIVGKKIEEEYIHNSYSSTGEQDDKSISHLSKIRNEKRIEMSDFSLRPEYDSSQTLHLSYAKLSEVYSRPNSYDDKPSRTVEQYRKFENYDYNINDLILIRFNNVRISMAVVVGVVTAAGYATGFLAAVAKSSKNK